MPRITSPGVPPSIAERILRGLALWCLVQGTVVALASPELLAWDARHEHVALQQRFEAHSHPWDEHHDPPGHGGRDDAQGDIEFAPATSGSVSLALPLLPGAGLVLPAAPPPLLAAALTEGEAPPDRPLTIEPPPPRALA